MTKLYPDAASALDGILRNDMLIAAGGFGLCGIPERLLDAIRDSGVTILLIEHVMHAVMSLSEHIYVLSYGKIIAEGAPREIVSNRDVVEAYLGRGAADQMSDVQTQGVHHA